MSVIYLDMDGVIADFFGGLAAKYEVDHWKSITFRDSIYVDLRNTDFFDTLGIFPTTAKMMTDIKQLAWQNELEWGICSSPLRGDTHNSAYWKRVWLQRMNFVPSNLENLVFTQNKHKHAVSPVDWRPNILIDDKPDNVRRFNEAGGIGIRYQANIDDYEEYLLPELENAIAIVNATFKSSDRV